MFRSNHSLIMLILTSGLWLSPPLCFFLLIVPVPFSFCFLRFSGSALSSLSTLCRHVSWHFVISIKTCMRERERELDWKKTKRTCRRMTVGRCGSHSHTCQPYRFFFSVEYRKTGPATVLPVILWFLPDFSKADTSVQKRGFLSELALKLLESWRP